jgi:hypothetical protein
LLLECGADPNIQRPGEESTPLHSAARWGDRQMVQLLLDHGADKTIQSPVGFPSGDLTAGQLAARYRHFDVADLLGENTARLRGHFEGLPQVTVAADADMRASAYLSTYIAFGLLGLAPVAILASMVVTWLRTGRLRLPNGKLPGGGLAVLCTAAGFVAGLVGLIGGVGIATAAACGANLLLGALIVVVLRRL